MAEHLSDNIGDVEGYYAEIWCHMGFDQIEGGHDYYAAVRAAGDR